MLIFIFNQVFEINSQVKLRKMNVDMRFITACAACKHQRKKCEPNCQLAPYFPSTKDEDFQNVYRLFGVNNTMKHLNSVADDQQAKLAETLILEAKIRKENPVHGSLAVERKLRAEIEALEKELKWHKIIFLFVRKCPRCK